MQYKNQDLTLKVDSQMLEEAMLNFDIVTFRNYFFTLHPYDQAQFYVEISPNKRQVLYTFLSPSEMAVVFREIELEQEQIDVFLKEMDSTYAADMLSYMYTDDVVDVLNELGTEQREAYLELMDEDIVEEINEFLNYDEYTAGSIMTTEYVSVYAHMTVREAMRVLREEAKEAETIYYIFVVNSEKQLVGVMSLRDLIIAEGDLIVSHIMSDRVVSVYVNEDQEEAARIMMDYNFLALPVIDENKAMLGIITVDDIIDVIEEEASEDYSKLAGISDSEDISSSPLKAAKSRLPWLIILLFLGMLTANLMSQFEATLEKVALLSIFIPLISGTSGNSGTQALAVAVRGIATGDVKNESKLKLLLREMLTGLFMGIACAVVVVGIVYFWKGELIMGLLVGGAILCSIFVATLAGSFIPLLMHRIGIDPAVASGPFITTLNDVTSLMIYLGLATIFINQIM